LAKIAVELKQALARRAHGGTPGQTTARRLGQGEGWSVSDLMCTSGPQDRRFEEQHDRVIVAVVIAGTFQYRSDGGQELMTPGALLLGNQGQSFECGHEHGAGDRCISFGYAPAYFERVASDAGNRHGARVFKALRLPPLRALSSLVARACAGLDRRTDTTRQEIDWEETGLQLAARAVQLACGVVPDQKSAPPGAVARVTRIVRWIERHPEGDLRLADMARAAELSPYHFLRVFEGLTGVTPHQYLLRTRLREAALRLAREPTKVIDIALDCGFGDVSNFNHTYRAEFGVSPRAYRAQAGLQPPLPKSFAT
jgi:AraC family transcriptional regulator